MGGRSVGKGVVHGGELGLYILLPQAYQLEGLHHDLRVVVAHRAGGELHAVAYQVVLVGGDGEGIDLAPLCPEQHLQLALGHGEGIVAELQRPGFLTDLIHGEIHDPAEFVALPVHVAGAEIAQLIAQYAGGLLGGEARSGGKAHKAVGLQAQGADDRVLFLLHELGDAAHQLALLV